MQYSKYKKSAALIILLVIALTLTSCGPSIIGVWTYTTLGLTVTLEFKSNGSMSVSTLSYNVQGTYKTNGDQLQLNADQSLSGIGLTSGTSTFRLSGDKLIIDSLTFTRFK